MKKSIYEIQNPTDFAPYSYDYLIQALANMGQRVGIKGDGIEYSNFTFADVIGTDAYKDADKYIGYMRYKQKAETSDTSTLVSEFGIIERGKLYDATNTVYTYESNTSRNIRNTVYISSGGLSFDLPINNIEKYSPYSLIHNDGKTLTTILVGRYFGMDDDDSNNCEIIYSKYDTETARLTYAIRCVYLYSDNNNDYYACIKLQETTDDENKYKCTVQIFSPQYMPEIFRTEFQKAFCYRFYQDIDEFQKFNILLPNIIDSYINVDELETCENNTYVDYNAAQMYYSIVDIMLHTHENLMQYEPLEFTVSYNTANEYSLLSLDDTTHNKSWQKYLINNFEIDIADYLLMMSNDIVTSFHNLYSYFNNIYYCIDKQTICTRIMCAMYEHIAQVDMSANIMDASQEYGVMYIPVDIKFAYTANSNNLLQIYQSDNVYVSIMDVTNSEYDKIIKNTRCILYDSEDDIETVKCIAFTIKYNSLYNDLIGYIDAYTVYTLPYITADNTWSVNDRDTSIRAIGADAGNPNIILLYTNNDTDTKVAVLNAFAKYDEINVTYEKRMFTVNPSLFVNADVTSAIECMAYIPVINEDNSSVFDNSIILSMSSVSCLSDENLQDNYIGNYILSMWKLNTVTCDEFEYIVDPEADANDPYALNLDNMSNMLANSNTSKIISGQWLKLKTRIYKLAHESDINDEYAWTIIAAKSADEYNHEIGIDSNSEDNKYQNDMNIIMQINRTVTTVGDALKYGEESPRYIEYEGTSVLGSTYVSNKLYPKYITYSYTTEETHEVPEQNENRHIYTVDITKIGYELLAVEQIYNITYAYSEAYYETITQDTKVSYMSYNDFYDEYVYNNDVPSLDLCEIITRNINVMNRVNMLSPDSDGRVYNAYIGTSWDESDKSTLHIGTSYANINIGNQTLINDYDKYTKFVKHDNIAIDFDNVMLNSEYVDVPNIWVKNIVNNTAYYTTSARLIGNVSYNDMYAYTWKYINENYKKTSVIDDVTQEPKYNGFGPQNSLYVCGETSNSIYADYAMITAYNDINDSSVLFRTIKVFANKDIENFTEPITACLPTKSKMNIDIYTDDYVITQDMLNNVEIGCQCNIQGDIIIGITGDSCFNENNEVVNDSITVAIQRSSGNGNNYNNTIKIYRPCYNIIEGDSQAAEETHKYIYGYHCIDIMNLFKYRLGIDLSQFETIEFDTGTNDLIDFTYDNHRYVYFIINDDLFDDVKFKYNTDYDKTCVQELNDDLKITTYKNANKSIHIKLRYDKTNRNHKLGCYTSTQADSLFSNEITG